MSNQVGWLNLGKINYDFVQSRKSEKNQGHSNEKKPEKNFNKTQWICCECIYNNNPDFELKEIFRETCMKNSVHTPYILYGSYGEVSLLVCRNFSFWNHWTILIKKQKFTQNKHLQGNLNKNLL